MQLLEISLCWGKKIYPSSENMITNLSLQRRDARIIYVGANVDQARLLFCEVRQ